MKETIEKRNNGTQPTHKCPCGEMATTSCTDAQQVPLNIGETQWVEGKPRYGCPAHPVQPMIHFATGESITAAEYERTKIQ